MPSVIGPDIIICYMLPFPLCIRMKPTPSIATSFPGLLTEIRSDLLGTTFAEEVRPNLGK